jgi:adenosylmethionine-8-amino-7-oxononanoate aminotransferase
LSCRAFLAETVVGATSRQQAAVRSQAKLHARLKREAMACGLMVYRMGGTIDGVNGDHVLLAPPFIVEESQVDAIVKRLGASLEAALADVR